MYIFLDIENDWSLKNKKISIKIIDFMSSESSKLTEQHILQYNQILSWNIVWYKNNNS